MTRWNTPLRLRYDLFTPLARTPWAGDKITKQLKKHLPDIDPAQRVGESWEMSCDPDMLSTLLDSPETLLATIATDPEGFLSPAQCARTESQLDLLVKIIQPAAPLSLQVHPRDDTPTLKPDECGKPESWYVLDADEGCGIYLGFKEAMSKDALEALLKDGNAAEAHVHFVPVTKGDYFDIEPGMPHMIGPGVTILEPQKVISAKKGKTYRMWDWGRTYDAQGKADPAGQPRELHVAESMALVEPERLTGPQLTAGARKTAEVQERDGCQWQVFPENSFCRLMIVTVPAGGTLPLGLKDGYGFIYGIAGEGSVTAVENGKEVNFYKGQSVFLPFGSYPLTLASGPGLTFAYIIPHGATVV